MIQVRVNIFYLVLDQTERIVDVVTEMKNGHYIKCKRDNKPVHQQTDIVQNEGRNYECGHDLFTSDTIEFTASVAMSRMDSTSRFPKIYNGILYPPSLGYSIFPVLRNNKAHHLTKSRYIYDEHYLLKVSPLF